MKEYSRHYTNDRKERDRLIHEVGMGTVIFSTIQYDEKRGKKYLYQITDTAILIVKATDRNLVITQMVARPSRIRRYWKNAPQELIDLAIAHTRAKMYI